MPDLHTDWIRDGSTADTPVTSSTPDLNAAPPVETPSAAVETPTVDTTPATAADAGQQAAAAAADQGASPEQQAAAAAAAVQEFIEGRVGDQPFQVPKNLMLPWKRGSEEGFVTIDEIRSAHMFERDYRIKTAQVAEERRQAEMQLTIERARLQAQMKALEEEREFATRAYADPEEQRRYEAHLEQYRTNPFYKQAFDQANKGRLLEAEQTAVRELQEQEALVGEAAAVWTTIQSLGAKYPGVDPDVVRTRYAAALQADQLPLSEQAIEHVYRTVADEASRYTAPLTAELEALRAKVAALETRGAAETHNDKTRTAITRAQNPVGQPVGGAPPAPVVPSRNLSGLTLRDRTSEWARQ